MQFSYSPAWLLLIFPVLALAAWWLYRSTNFSKTASVFLGIIRFFVLAVLAFLLLKPVVNYYQREVEKPTLAVLIDNSASVLAAQTDSAAFRQNLKQWQNQLAEQYSDKYQVDFFYFDSELRSGQEGAFTGTQTAISKAITATQEQYPPQSLEAIVLASDGVANQGLAPEYLQAFPQPVHTVLLGDSTVKPDLAIKNVAANSQVYLNNSFPVKVSWSKKQMPNIRGLVAVYQGNQQVALENVNLVGSQGSLVLNLKATQPGVQLYRVQLSGGNTDSQLDNNEAFFSVRVAEKTTRVAMLYDKPTPDVGAFVQALRDYQGLDLVTQPMSQYDASEEYQGVFLFLSGAPSAEALEPLRESKAGIWAFIRNANHATALQSIPGFPSVQLDNSSQKNLILPLVNQNYTAYDFDKNWEKTGLLQPLQAPLGTPSVAAAFQPVLYQQIGTLKTQLPLVALFQTDTRKGLLSLGWDWWKLRMSFYQQTGNHQSFDNWASAMVQFLTAATKKDQLQVTLPDFFYETEKPTATAVVYNASGNPVSGATVNMLVQASATSNSYDFAFAPSGNGYRLPLRGLPPGRYTYTASAEVEGKGLEESGTFAVLPGSVEQQNLTANTRVMQKLASNSGGTFSVWGNTANLEQNLQQNEAPGIMRATLEIQNLISWKWLCFVLTLLLGLEWYFRKQLGSE